MTSGWLILLCGAGIVAGLVFAARRRRADANECGTVSDQWLAEQRTHDRHYSER